MTADFTGSVLMPPPGINQPPRVIDRFPEPIWWSPTLASDSSHLLVGGRTIWVEDGSVPASMVVAHPNRFGSGEDLAGLGRLADKYGALAYVLVDPLLISMVDLASPLLPSTIWPGADRENLALAGERSLQAADALRRRLAQVPGVLWPVQRPTGRTVACLTPLRAAEMKARLGTAGVFCGAEEEAGRSWWEGIITFTLGWWHTRRQIEGVASAVAAVLAGRIPDPVPADSYTGIPDDLPRRKLNRIRDHLRGV